MADEIIVRTFSENEQEQFDLEINDLLAIQRPGSGYAGDDGTGHIKSNNYAVGSAGFKIDHDGEAEFNKM